MLNIGNDGSDFFQTTADIAKEKLREKKRSNVLGDPIALGSKLICIKPIHSPLLKHSPSILITDGSYLCRIFDPVDRKVVAKFKGHLGPVTCVTHYHDHKAMDTFLFTGSWDKSVIQWSLKLGSMVKQFTFHTQFVKCVALSPDHTHMYSGSQDKTIRKTNLVSGDSETWLGHTMAVHEIIPFENVVYSCGSDGTIRQWDEHTGVCLKTIRAHETSIHGLLLDDEEEVLFSSSPDKFVKRWSLHHLENPESIFEHPDSVKAILPLKCGVLVTGCRDEKIRIWDLVTGKLMKIADGHFDEISCLCEIEGKVYSCSYDGTLRTWLIKDFLDPNINFDLLHTISDDNFPRKLKALTEEEQEELDSLMEDNE